MPHISSHLFDHGPTLDVLVMPSELRLEALARVKGFIPAPVPARALIDTGGSQSCIGQKLVDALELQPTGGTSILTPSTGADGHEVNTYDITLSIKITDSYSKRYGPLPVICTDFTNRPFDVLIGRDILANALLIYDGPMKLVTIAF